MINSYCMVKNITRIVTVTNQIKTQILNSAGRKGKLQNVLTASYNCVKRRYPHKHLLFKFFLAPIRAVFRNFTLLEIDLMAPFSLLFSHNLFSITICWF